MVDVMAEKDMAYSTQFFDSKRISVEIDLKKTRSCAAVPGRRNSLLDYNRFLVQIYIIFFLNVISSCLLPFLG